MNYEQPKVRKATDKEIEECITDLHMYEHKVIFKDYKERRVEIVKYIRTLIDACKSGKYVTALSNGRGLIAFGENPKGQGHIYALYTYPAFRRQGVGRQLIQAAISKLKSKFKILNLNAVKNNKAAVALYTSVGFKSVKEAKYKNISIVHMERVEK